MTPRQVFPLSGKPTAPATALAVVAPWRDIQAQGWIAPADCVEVRVTLTESERLRYATAETDERYRVCSTARSKLSVVAAILARHPDEPTLVIGAYLDQLEELGEALDAPVVQAVRVPVQAVGGLSLEEAIEMPRRGAPLVVLGAPLTIAADSFHVAAGDLKGLLTEITRRIRA